MQRSATAGPDSLTVLLARAGGGNVEAFNELFPVVYGELRRLAHRRLRAERDNHTLSTTALVHEAYIKLVGQERVHWQNRAHFYAVASRAMRRILTNHALSARADKRGGGAIHIQLEDSTLIFSSHRVDELLALDEALERLRVFNPRGADVVTYRFFGGLSHEEIAGVMGISTVTVRRSWGSARSWLRRELRDPALGRSGSPEDDGP